MRRVGIWFLVLGVLNFALPRLGYDLRWFEFLGAARNWVAAALLIAGAVLLVLGSRRKASA